MFRQPLDPGPWREKEFDFRVSGWSAIPDPPKLQSRPFMVFLCCHGRRVLWMQRGRWEGAPAGGRLQADPGIQALTAGFLRTGEWKFLVQFKFPKEDSLNPTIGQCSGSIGRIVSVQKQGMAGVRIWLLLLTTTRKPENPPQAQAQIFCVQAASGPRTLERKGIRFPSFRLERNPRSPEASITTLHGVPLLPR